MAGSSASSGASLSATLPFLSLPLCHKAHVQDIVPFDPTVGVGASVTAAPGAPSAAIKKHNLSRRPACGMPHCPQPSMSTHKHCYFCNECNMYTCIACTTEQNEVFKLLVMINEAEDAMAEGKRSFARTGEMHKKGMGMLYRPWAKRSFALTFDHTLSYFNGSVHRGLLNIRGCSIQLLMPREADGRSNALQIEAPLVLRSKTLFFRSRDLVLAVDSAKDCAEWCASLLCAIRSASENAPGAVPDRASGSNTRRPSTNAGVAGSFMSTAPAVGNTSIGGANMQVDDDQSSVHTITNNAGILVPDTAYTSNGVTAAMVINAYIKQGVGGRSKSASGIKRPLSLKLPFIAGSAITEDPNEGKVVNDDNEDASSSMSFSESGSVQGGSRAGSSSINSGGINGLGPMLLANGAAVPPELRGVFVGMKVQKKTAKENMYRTRFIWMDGIAQTFNWAKRMSKSGDRKSVPINVYSRCVLDLPIVIPVLISKDKLRGYSVRLISRSTIEDASATSDPYDAPRGVNNEDIDLRFDMKDQAQRFIDAFFLINDSKKTSSFV